MVRIGVAGDLRTTVPELILDVHEVLTVVEEEGSSRVSETVEWYVGYFGLLQ